MATDSCFGLRTVCKDTLKDHSSINDPLQKKATALTIKHQAEYQDYLTQRDLMVAKLYPDFIPSAIEDFMDRVAKQTDSKLDMLRRGQLYDNIIKIVDEKFKQTNPKCVYDRTSRKYVHSRYGTKHPLGFNLSR